MLGASSPIGVNRLEIQTHSFHNQELFGKRSSARFLVTQSKFIPIPSPGLLLGMVEGVVVAVGEAVAEVVRSVWPVTGWVVLVVEALAWLMDEIKTR